MGNGTNIGRVRALGSAHSGAHHWLAQRFTAIGNMALGIFLLFSLVGRGEYSFDAMRVWVAQPLPATALALFVVSAFWHARLGLMVVIEDYAHEHANKFAAIALLNLATFAGAAAALSSIARIVMAALGQQAAHDAIQAVTGGR